MRSVFDRFYKRYDNWYEKNRYVYHSELGAIRRILPRGKGLEIGVGTGRFAAPLGIQRGIDPSQAMIQMARRRGVKAQTGYGENLPFQNKTFDYVALFITLCFVKSPAKVLKEARRVLKQKGKIVVGIIDKNSFLGQSYQIKKSVFYQKANFFGVHELIKMLEAAGFKKIIWRQTLFKPLREIKRVESSRKGFGKGAFVVVRAEKTTSQRKKRK